MEKNNKDIILSIKNLNVYFKSHGKDAHVIRGIDLDIERNECFAIVGESGSGKSVFTKTFTGMIDTNGKVKNGSIILNGVEIADPKIVRRRFSDIRRFETVELKRHERSATALGERDLEKAEKKFQAKIKALDDKEVKIDAVKHIEQQIRELDKKFDKKFYYVNAYYSNQLNLAFNKGSKLSVKRQRKNSEFEKYLHRFVHEADFEKADHSNVFAKLLEEKLLLNQEFVLKDNLIKTLEEEKKQFAEGAPGRILINKKIAALSRKRERIYIKQLGTVLSQYIADQKPSFPPNKVAYQDLLDVLKAPLAKALSNYQISEDTRRGLAELESSLVEISKEFDHPSPRTVNSAISKAVALKDRQLHLLALDYKRSLEEGKVTEPFSTLEHDEIYEDVFESVSALRYIVKDLKEVNTAIDEVLDQLNKTYFSPGEQEKLQVNLKELEKKYAIIETQHIGGCFKSDIIAKYQRAIYIAESEVSMSVFHLIRSISDNAQPYLSHDCEVLRENNKILINQLRAAKESDWSAVEAERATRIEAIKTNTTTDVEGLKKSHDAKKVLEEAHQKEIKEIEKANKARYEKYVEKANSMLANSTLTAEEKTKFADYDERDVAKIISAQKTIDVLSEQQQKLVVLLDTKIEEMRKAATNNDLTTVKAISKEVQFEYRYFDKRLQKEQKDYNIRLNMIEKKLTTLSNSDVDKRRKELLMVEKGSIESSHLAFAEQIKNEILNALKTFSKENNSSYANLQVSIHDVKYAVKKNRSIYRKLRQVLRIKKPMLAELRDNGVVRGNSINLAKLKNNRQWSMIRGSHIATIFQDPMTSLNPLIKIGKQITDVLMLHHNMTKKQAREEAIELLRKVHIPNPEERFDEYPFQYSGGMRQRVVIAIALACRPDILICDEPTTALDVTVQAQILALIKELQQEYNFTIIFITHDLGVVAGVADRIGVMYGGQIIEYGTDQDIFYNPAHPYTWALLSSLPQLAVANEPLVYIRGNPPVFTHEIEGDSFAPRSDYAMRIDYMKEPPMFQISPTHFAKTWLLDPRAPKVKKPTLIRNLSKRMEQTASSFLATSKGE